MENLKARWDLAVGKLEKIFGEDLDMQAILFLIGVQELGKGRRKFNKRQKLEVIHIAVCTLLSDYGFYEFKGYDEDGWPHWSRTQKLPHLNGLEQEKLMMEAIVLYVDKKELV